MPPSSQSSCVLLHNVGHISLGSQSKSGSGSGSATDDDALAAVSFDAARSHVMVIQRDRDIGVLSVGGSDADAGRLQSVSVDSKGYIRAAKYSAENRYLGVLRSAKALELFSVNGSDVSKVNDVVKDTKSSDAILGFEWTFMNEFFLITTVGVELYQMSESRKIFVLRKTIPMSINWHIFSPSNNILLVFSNMSALCFFHIKQNFIVTSLPSLRFDSPKHQGGGVSMDPALLLYRISKSQIRLEFELILEDFGDFYVSVVDNLVLASNVSTRKTLVFDVRGPSPSDKGGAAPSDKPKVLRHYSMVEGCPINIFGRDDDEDSSFLYNDWQFCYPNFVLAQSQASIYDIHVDLVRIVNEIRAFHAANRSINMNTTSTTNTVSATPNNPTSNSSSKPTERLSDLELLRFLLRRHSDDVQRLASDTVRRMIENQEPVERLRMAFDAVYERWTGEVVPGVMVSRIKSLRHQASRSSLRSVSSRTSTSKMPPGGRSSPVRSRFANAPPPPSTPTHTQISVTLSQSPASVLNPGSRIAGMGTVGSAAGTLLMDNQTLLGGSGVVESISVGIGPEEMYSLVFRPICDANTVPADHLSLYMLEHLISASRFETPISTSASAHILPDYHHELLVGLLLENNQGPRVRQLILSGVIPDSVAVARKLVQYGRRFGSGGVKRSPSAGSATSSTGSRPLEMIFGSGSAGNRSRSQSVESVSGRNNRWGGSNTSDGFGEAEFQLGVDMLIRMGMDEEVVDAMISAGKILDALKHAITTQALNLFRPSTFLDPTLAIGDRTLFLNVYRVLDEAGLLGGRRHGDDDDDDDDMMDSFVDATSRRYLSVYREFWGEVVEMEGV
ncbi:hypothetical protein HDU76_000012 [Blyttiomyces sp. JEL0837]|nr:hypothetical protein HDU76_000012 [Blyttiomyces sp. JEL0837]